MAGKNADQLTRRRLAHATEKSGDVAGSITIWQGLVTDFPNEQVNKNNLARVQELAKTAARPNLTAYSVAGGAALLGVAVWRKRDTDSRETGV